MHSADGQADFVEQNYTYFLYLMGASSRGEYPPRFGGMLWYTNGDMRRWGSQYWWANTERLLRNLHAGRPARTDGPDVLDVQRHVSTPARWPPSSNGARRASGFRRSRSSTGRRNCRTTSRRRLQDLMLVRKPYAERSAKFQWWIETKNRHNAR